MQQPGTQAITPIPKGEGKKRVKAPFFEFWDTSDASFHHAHYDATVRIARTPAMHYCTLPKRVKVMSLSIPYANFKNNSLAHDL